MAAILWQIVKPRLHQGNMLPGNMLPVSRKLGYSFMSRSTCILCIQQQTGNKLATILLPITSNMLTVTGNMLRTNMLPWCKRGFSYCRRKTSFFLIFFMFITSCSVTAKHNKRILYVTKRNRLHLSHASHLIENGDNGENAGKCAESCICIFILSYLHISCAFLSIFYLLLCYLFISLISCS